MPPTQQPQYNPLPPVQKSNPLMIPLAIVIGFLLVAVAIIYTGMGTKSAPTDTTATPDSTNVTIAPVTDKDHILGNPQATLMVVEYSDLECPFCKQFHITMQQMMKDFGTNGQVAWVYRHFPLYKGTEATPPLHSRSGKESEASECANELGGPTAFWKYIDTIYQITPSNNQLDPAKLPDVAQQIGLNRAKFESCLSSGKYAPKVEASYNEALTAGAQGTPYTVIIDTRSGKPYPITQGAVPYSILQTLIKSILAQKTN